MNAFTGGHKRDWKLDISVPAKINSKITFIPAKNNVRETAQQVKILFKCSCHLHGALGENDLLQTPL